MKNYQEQFDDIEGELKGEFAADLKGLLEPTNSVPQAVDKKIIVIAQARFSRKNHFQFLRWLAPLAAAAAIILVVMLYTPQDSSRKVIVAQKELTKEDIDRSGTVDILDAMKLDMQIKNAAAGPEYDFNKDGLINKKDVDTVAYVAVRINKGI